MFFLIIDGFVKKFNFCVALHPSSLQRTISTPHSSGFERLEFEAFCFAVLILTFYELVIVYSELIIKARST